MSATAVVPKPAPTPPAPSRMRLDSLVKGKRAAPPRIVLGGVEGIGKSTLAANAPKPIFLGAEDGTGQLDVTRFSTPETWPDVLEAVRVLAQEKHDFETLAIDTLDWVEPLIWGHICKRDGMKNIEDYGYGKGYTAALDEWRLLLAAMERLRKVRPMNVILIAHTWIKPFKNPEGPDFDRYELKLHLKAAGLVKEWADAVLFANYETFAQPDKVTKRVKGVSSGARLLYTERTAAYDAKNRYGLPPEIPLDWAELAKAIATGHVAEPETLAAEIRRKAPLLGPDMEKTTLESLARCGNDTSKLAQLNNWVAAKAAGKEA